MVNRKVLVPYCVGAPGLAPSSPASPVGGGGGGAFLSEAAGPFMALVGGAPWGLGGSPQGPRALTGAEPNGRAEGGASRGPQGSLALIGGGPLSPEAPRLPIGPLNVPRAPIGQDARPRMLPLRPEEELDGCEAEPPEDAVPSPTPSPPGEPPEDRLRSATLAVVGRYLREAAGLKGSGAAPEAAGPKVLLQGLWGRLGAHNGTPPEVDRALETLRRVGGGILDKHQLAFQGMLRKMEIKNESDLKTVSEVAKFVFDDGVTNWGRITTLIAFGAFVAKHLKSINQEGCVGALAEIITDVLVTDKRDWLVEHDGWEGFVKFFHVEDIEGSVRSVLMAFAGVAGLGASLAYMIR